MKRLIIFCLVVVGQSLTIGTTVVAQATHENVVLIKAEEKPLNGGVFLEITNGGQLHSE